MDILQGLDANILHALAGAAISSLSCLLAYGVCAAVSSWRSVSYQKLSGPDKRDWNSRTGSTLHALVITALAIFVAASAPRFFFDSSFQKEVPRVLRTNSASYASLGVSLGYFVVDMILVCLFYPTLGGLAMVCHHAAATCSVVTAIYTGNAHMLTLLMLATEITTPFINLRWYLEKVGWKSSPAYKFNGAMIFLSWLVARILVFPPFFWFLWLQRKAISENVTIFGQILVVVVPILLCALNIFWFWKIVKGVIKLFAAPAPTTKADHKE